MLWGWALIGTLLPLLPFLSCTSEELLPFSDETARFLQCPVKTEQQLHYLRSLASEGKYFDVLEEHMPEDGGWVRVLTTPDVSRELLAKAGCCEQKSQHSWKFLLQPQDVDSSIVTGPAFDDRYRSYDAMLAQIKYYGEEYPQLFQDIATIGHSHEGRALIVLHMSTAPLGTRPQIWIQAGQHAREWISPAGLFAGITSLIDGFNRGNETVTQFLSDYELVLLPMVNPDGYEYSRRVNRMWRKNRASPNGVDLNRNWNVKWGEFGCPRSSTAEDYCGPSAASEPEVAAVQEYVLKHVPNRVLGFDIHSYSQLVLYNYGWTRSPSPADKILRPIAHDIAAQMTKAQGARYTAQQSAGLAAVCGGADDWMYMVAGIPGFVLEIRDKGEYGFKLPASHIRASGQEILAGIMEARQHLVQIQKVHPFPNPEIVLEEEHESVVKAK